MVTEAKCTLSTWIKKPFIQWKPLYRKISLWDVAFCRRVYLQYLLWTMKKQVSTGLRVFECGSAFCDKRRKFKTHDEAHVQTRHREMLELKTRCIFLPAVLD